CVVEQEMARAERRPGAISELLHRCWVGDVAAHTEHVGAVRLELRCRLLEQRVLDVGDDDLGTLADELLAQRLADAAGAASDDGDLAREALHPVPPAVAFRLRFENVAATVTTRRRCPAAPRAAPRCRRGCDSPDAWCASRRGPGASPSSSPTRVR